MSDTRRETQDTRKRSKRFLATVYISFFSGIFISLFLFLSSCGEKKKEKKILNATDWKKHALNPTYAKGFTIYENDSVIRFTSRNPDDTNQIYKTLDFNKKELPFSKIAITSTTHAFLFDAIGANNSIVGMSAMSYLLDSNLKATYTKNKVVELGKDDNLNREIIIKLNPQALMVYPCPGCDYSDYEKAGITVVNNAEYLEQDPLGRAEWIKVAGLITGRWDWAIPFFDSLEYCYKSARDDAKRIYEVATKDSVPRFEVILGKPIDNTWHVPGNESFAAKLIKDAMGYYAFEEVTGNNVKSQNLEWIISESKNAKFWIFTDYSPQQITMTSLSKQNKVFETLPPFKNHNVIVCNSAKDDFFGKAVIQPNVLLQDLIHHFWGVNKNYKPVYFKKLAKK